MPFIEYDIQQNANSNLALDAIIRAEQVEVLLRNLVSLQHVDGDRFVIPFDDVIVTLNLAIPLLDKD